MHTNVLPIAVLIVCLLLGRVHTQAQTNSPASPFHAVTPSPDSSSLMGASDTLSVVQIGKVVSFTFTSSKSINLSQRSMMYYNKVVQLLKRDTGLIVHITGYADNEIDAEESRKLSEDRALQVRGYFMRQGIPRRRLFTAGKSFQNPVASNSTENGRAYNRRVEIQVVNK